MKNTIKLLGLGIAGWLIPFAVSLIAFPLKQNNYPLFETIMSVTLVCVAVFLSFIWLKKVTEDYTKRGLTLGLTLLLVNLLIDLILFMPTSPMQMTFADYMKDIGLTYIIFPVITLGIALILKKNNNG